MKSRFTFSLSILFLFCMTMQAQIDQVSVGSSYSQQAYYSIATGEVTTMDNDAWDIGFSNISQQDAGIFINESSSLAGVSLEAHLTLAIDWSEDLTDISSYTEDTRLFNVEENWTEGAFNMVKDPMNPFDYGWGTYNPQTHTLEGTFIYVIKLRNDNYLKFQVVNLLNGVYNIRYANLDGTNEVTKAVSRIQNAAHPFIPFSFESGEVVPLPTDYDLIFQRYTTPLDDDEGGILQYTVTGTLIAPGVEAVMADEVDPQTVEEADYSSDYSTAPTTIGHEWKVYDFTLGWIVETDRAYFVKAKDGNTYKIVFYDFEGAGTGTTTLEKTLIGTSTAIFETEDESSISIFPNPMTDAFSTNLDIPSTYNIYNQQGQLIQRGTIAPRETISLKRSFLSGNYFLEVKADESTFVKKITVQ